MDTYFLNLFQIFGSYNNCHFYATLNLGQVIISVKRKENLVGKKDHMLSITHLKENMNEWMNNSKT